MTIRTQLLGVSFLVLSTTAAAEPLFTSVDVFQSGTEGYHTFRIPAVATAPDGSLIAFAEGRRENRHDPSGGDIDLVLKRSSDRGATWSSLVIPGHPWSSLVIPGHPWSSLVIPGHPWSSLVIPGHPWTTPVRDGLPPIQPRSPTAIRPGSGSFYNRWEPASGTELSQPGTSNNQTWTRYSEDNGETWSEARDLTRASRDYEDWGAMFPRPGGAIQTRGGRLIVPSAMKPDTYYVQGAVGDYSGRIHFMRAYVMYSDDHGSTWRRSALVRALTNENQVVELSDGAVMMDARQGGGAHRWLAVSADAGETWPTPVPGQKVTPVCTSIERYTLHAAGDDRDRILWTGPTGPGRKHLVLRVSYDEGQTFRKEHVIYDGLAAYSDITILKDKTVGVLWERGVSDGYQFITFTRFDGEFVDSGI